jgi:hypothetical protein
MRGVRVLRPRLRMEQGDRRSPAIPAISGFALPYASSARRELPLVVHDQIRPVVRTRHASCCSHQCRALPQMMRRVIGHVHDDLPCGMRAYFGEAPMLARRFSAPASVWVVLARSSACTGPLTRRSGMPSFGAMCAFEILCNGCRQSVVMWTLPRGGDDIKPNPD